MLRRALYQDLAALFETADGFLEEPRIYDEQRQRDLRRHLKLDGHNYIKNKQDLFMRLPERSAADAIYTYFRLILSDPEDKSLSHAERARSCFASNVQDGSFNKDFWKAALGKVKARQLLARTELLNQNREAGVRFIEQSWEQGPNPGP